jgi:pimeloyl-ACP methyl ester carboxylesterase
MSAADTQSPARSRRIVLDRGSLNLVDRPGEDPTVVLMHGFPDDHHIYDLLTPLLANRTVAFDWLGYGDSDRPDGTPLDPPDRQSELTGLIDALGVERVVLVGHDASGPEAIDWAIGHADRVDRLVLLNTYYGSEGALRLPQLIRLLAEPALAPLADALLDDLQQRQWLLRYTARQFGAPEEDDEDGIAARAIVPQFFGTPNALPAIRAWVADLHPALERQDRVIAAEALKTLAAPVSVAFGAGDPFLGPDVARHLAGLFGGAEVDLVEEAGHWPQWDQAEAVAQTIATAAARRG